nr:hypothetical protein [Roseiflexus sp.]
MMTMTGGGSALRRALTVTAASSRSPRLTTIDHHHRIDHRLPHLGAAQNVGHALDDRRRAGHAVLDRVGADVVEHRSDPGDHQIGRKQFDRLRAEGVLGGDGAGLVDAVGHTQNFRAA